jgi:hypothetical protein
MKGPLASGRDRTGPLVGFAAVLAAVLALGVTNQLVS